MKHVGELMLLEGKMLIEKCKKKKKEKRKLQTMTQLMAKLREREMKSARVLKRGTTVNRDNYQVTEQLFLLPHLFFKNSEFCSKTIAFVMSYT
jgi:flagella basal body P-ring formation protein FlgA